MVGDQRSCPTCGVAGVSITRGELTEGVILLEGPEFDEAVLGVSYADGRVVYDVGRVMRVLRDGNEDWDAEDVLEWFEFNVLPLGAMEGGPLFVEGVRLGG